MAAEPSDLWAGFEAGEGRTMAEFVQASHTLMVATRGKGFTDITEELRRWLARLSAEAGLLTVFVRHTSASLVIQENADPNVRRDLMEALAGLAPESAPYHHAEEGPDDMPSHIKSMLTDVSLSIPVAGGRLALGAWQGVYLIEHRAAPHERSIALNFLGHCADA
jgi:secondary thiamine-phosphate synthase enzyme